MTTTDKPPPTTGNYKGTFVGKYTGDLKLQKMEGIKDRANYLSDPLKDEMKNDEIFVSGDAVVVLKYHGSYMQDNRELRKKGEEKKYSFMLRLKSPAGEIPPDLYRTLDDLSRDLGQGDLRATTRQAWQMHGILKGNLKEVISTIIKAGSSTIGACGDVSRNVMTSPAPLATKDYQYMRTYSNVIAELFKPQSTALTQLWLGEEKVAKVDYWLKDVGGIDVKAEMLKDTGRGVIVEDPVEPLYGSRYLPRKFKVGITVPGDNSLDIYTNDIGMVVITDDDGELEGFNIMVGGGMGRTHNKETTFARAADHLGFVGKDDVLEFMKCILATQRDHGNRDVRPNARMKYLVHTYGIDGFRSLVEEYFGKKIQPWRPIPEFKYMDWMGWHEQGDGKYFLGVNIEQGRVKDVDGTSIMIKKGLRKVVDDYDLTMILTPTQSIIFKDILEKDKSDIEKILVDHGMPMIGDVDPLTRLSMACPALPLCGLAVTEAERIMPTFITDVRSMLDKLGIRDDIIMRMTGCPNGCARPYMSELALVGDGPNSYQIWLGGSPDLTRTGYPFVDRVKYDDMDDTLTPLFEMWKKDRHGYEAFGDFAVRAKEQVLEYGDNLIDASKAKKPVYDGP